MADVLLVDDDAEANELVSLFLRRAGHTVRCVANGREALGAIIIQTPDVIVLDVNMPQMDGVSFLEVVRCYLRWESLPVILLTGLAEGPHIHKAAELRVRKTFIKADYTITDLLAQIEACAPPVIEAGDACHHG
ncbi:MAG TPA: response regulator [Tepidisphaeraceae bacterium]|nr:response regulator [Tepidisphaeraceae bacterium]